MESPASTCRLRRWHEDRHIGTLTLFFATSFPHENPEDVVPYTTGYRCDGVVRFAVNPDGTAMLQVASAFYDNDESNRVGESFPNAPAVDENPESSKASPIFYFDIDGDRLRISGLDLSGVIE